MTKDDAAAPDWREITQNAAMRAVLGGLLLLPYRLRVPFAGWVISTLVAPLVGWRRRIADNLRRTCPDLSPAEIKRLQREVPNNAGRTLIEIYSGQDFIDRVKDTAFEGPGVAAFEEARAAGRPVILVTAHFGNYDAPRAALFAQGYPLGALYRRMRNARFNDHYVRAISQIGEPVFPVDKRGILGLIRHLGGGGIIGILVDVYAIGGADLTFFGQPAPTAVSAGEWALKYDALIVPIYGVRQPDGLSFRIVLDAPVPHGTPEEIGQALNDSLEAQVRKNMAQWFWIHRRWAWKYESAP